MVGETPCTLTIHRDGVKLIENGRCKGIDMSWNDTVGGDAALAAAPQGSLAAWPLMRRIVPMLKPTLRSGAHG